MTLTECEFKKLLLVPLYQLIHWMIGIRWQNTCCHIDSNI